MDVGRVQLFPEPIIVMAHMVMAHMVMAYMVMAYIPGTVVQGSERIN